MKYKVGDKVKIRSDLQVHKFYGPNEFTSPMREWLGQVVEINSIYQDSYLMIDGRGYMWTDEMIEGLALEASNDSVNHPSYYTDGKIEVIDFIRDKHLDFCRGNIVKYVARAGKKGDKTKELEDLKKARQYCDFAIEMLEAEDERQ
jgi:hypothetical protein